mmetsp:Transcript_15577/g.60899  ORF Transcript_15577/g.60899 Transcript_15577/m.60899 type:complete len:359 (-) Transcript_15577:8-1084(-)
MPLHSVREVQREVVRSCTFCHCDAAALKEETTRFRSASDWSWAGTPAACRSATHASLSALRSARESPTLVPFLARPFAASFLLPLPPTPPFAVPPATPAAWQPSPLNGNPSASSSTPVLSPAAPVSSAPAQGFPATRAAPSLASTAALAAASPPSAVAWASSAHVPAVSSSRVMVGGARGLAAAAAFSAALRGELLLSWRRTNCSAQERHTLERVRRDWTIWSPLFVSHSASRRLPRKRRSSCIATSIVDSNAMKRSLGDCRYGMGSTSSGCAATPAASAVRRALKLFSRCGSSSPSFPRTNLLGTAPKMSTRAGPCEAAPAVLPAAASVSGLFQRDQLEPAAIPAGIIFCFFAFALR